jgi:hypothetical protein
VAWATGVARKTVVRATAAAPATTVLGTERRRERRVKMILSSGLRRNVGVPGGAPQSRGDTHRNCFVAFGAELEQVVRPDGSRVGRTQSAPRIRCHCGIAG